MDVTLVTVTVISLTMAFAMGVVTWRLMREERRRSDARVAALMADLRRWDVGTPEQAVWHARDLASPVDTPKPAPARRRAVPAAPAARARPARSAGTAGTPPVAESASGLFAPIRGSSAVLRRVLATVAAAVVVVAVVSFVVLFGLSGDVPADPAAGTSRPVELLSLAHARKGDYLAITGSIRNPSGGIERGQLSVTATVFDRDGIVVGTGQTPLPVAVLPPGGETPFTISLPDADRINRYRISFMQGQTSVPHVDRRRLNDQARSAVGGENPASHRGPS